MRGICSDAYRIHDDEIDRARPQQHVCDLERLFTGIRLGNEELVDVDAEAAGVIDVERMLRELFGHEPDTCHKLAETVDTDGRAIVLTTTKEHAELKRDQIQAYGKDDLQGSTGSMWSTIEAAE